MSFDLAAIRKGLVEIVAAGHPSLNVYGWPDPQPEYPAFTLGWAEPVSLHVAQCRDGVRLEMECSLLVANADIEAATANLEAYISFTGPSVIETLETADAPADAWSNLVVNEVRNFRRLENLDGLGCDLALSVHC